MIATVKQKDAMKIVHEQRYSTRINGFMSMTQVVIDSCQTTNRSFPNFFAIG